MMIKQSYLDFVLILNIHFLKKGYVEDHFGLDKKKDLLLHIKEIGSGEKDDGTKLEKNNKLISHYLKTQKIEPL